MEKKFITICIVTCSFMTAEKLRDFHQTQLNPVMKFCDKFYTKKNSVNMNSARFA